ncbi:MAG: hypothetical protein IRZ18_04975 [Clostridia bacterium]|nr:hypothetical protein [Clostridia bacterium]
MATSWLAAGGATAPSEPGPAFAGAWAAAPPPAQWEEEEALAARIASLWERLRPLHNLDPDAAREVDRAQETGAVAALVCDDGDLVAALFLPAERDAAAARLARMGLRAARPRLASTGLVVRVSVAPASSARH